MVASEGKWMPRILRHGQENSAIATTRKDSYVPRATGEFHPQRIVLTRGCDLPIYRPLIDGICRAYPEADRVELDLPHNKVDLGGGDPLALHERGKQTLVFGIHHSAVRRSSEGGNTCPNYWHFSPYGFCPYGCHYCYLAGAQGVRFSPTVKIFLNLWEIVAEIDRAANRDGEPTAFYLGKLQDGLALDSLTGYSRWLVPFFARHPLARMTLLTKSAEVTNLLDLDHRGHTILSWSLNPAEVIAEFEVRTPSLTERIVAMKKCAAAGYPVRAVVMPVIPVADWEVLYARFFERLLAEAPLDRLTLGGICSYSAARDLMERKLGKGNVISERLIQNTARSADGRRRYPRAVRERIYRYLLEMIRRSCPDLPVGLCLEEPSVFEALGLTAAVGRCNCVL